MPTARFHENVTPGPNFIVSTVAVNVWGSRSSVDGIPPTSFNSLMRT